MSEQNKGQLQLFKVTVGGTIYSISSISSSCCCCSYTCLLPATDSIYYIAASSIHEAIDMMADLSFSSIERVECIEVRIANKGECNGQTRIGQ